jgi:hypothetical protein
VPVLGVALGMEDEPRIGGGALSLHVGSLGGEAPGRSLAPLP